MIDHLLLAHGLLALYLVVAITTAAHVLLHVRDPHSAWGWIAVIWLAPLAGSALYYAMGFNRTRLIARRAAGSLEDSIPRPLPEDAIPPIAVVAPEELAELMHIGRAMSHRPLVAGNRVRTLHNGEQAYPAMLSAIQSAREFVWLSSYIFEGAGIGGEFVQALVAAHLRGVQVRVLIDGVGDLYARPRASSLLRRAGVEVERFEIPRRFRPVPYLNLRNHRKLLIVDGHCAFMGGINIRDRHFSQGQEQPILDLHFQVEGPVIDQLQDVFRSDWQTSSGRHIKGWPSAPGIAGASFCRVITDGPNEAMDRLQLALIGALATAHQRVSIMTPYFIPTPELASALSAAAQRGVKVRLLLPRHSNLPWVDWASKHWLPSLLNDQLELFWRPAPFAHSKLFIVDHYYAQVGSANLDPRSLQLNFELMLEVYDTGLIEHLERHFDESRKDCPMVGVQELMGQSLPIRLRNALFWLFSPYL